MKVDIEGADQLCLEGLTPFDELPLFLSTEYPMSLSGQVRVLLLLRKLGYQRFQVVDQMSVPSQVPPRPAREGRYVDVKLEINGSGLFGKELPGGDWLTLDSAILHFVKLFARNKRMGLLRRLPVVNRFAVMAPGTIFTRPCLPPLEARRRTEIVDIPKERQASSDSFSKSARPSSSASEHAAPFFRTTRTFGAPDLVSSRTRSSAAVAVSRSSTRS
jgi:hypothetical protein